VRGETDAAKLEQIRYPAVDADEFRGQLEAFLAAGSAT
jgi:hypothetical protein